VEDEMKLSLYLLIIAVALLLCCVVVACTGYAKKESDHCYFESIVIEQDGSCTYTFRSFLGTNLYLTTNNPVNVSLIHDHPYYVTIYINKDGTAGFVIEPLDIHITGEEIPPKEEGYYGEL
jgi:hypothetical protein